MKMSHFKKWLDGDKDLFNVEVEPKPLDERNYKKIDKVELDKSITQKEKRKIIHDRIKGDSVVHLTLSIITFIAYITILIAMTTSLSKFGEAGMTWNYISRYYIDNSLFDTKAVNSITGMILDYRAFDTLGESFVLFSGVTCVFILLQGIKDDDSYLKKHKQYKEFAAHYDQIVRCAAKILIPIVFIFGIYVVLNGHLSPGGGFSGGAILGAGLILFSLAFGDEVAGKFFTLKTFKTISAIALFGYSFTKCYSFLMGGMHYHDPIADWFHSLANGSILSGGYILILNICVGAVVACTMYGFYSLFKKGEI